MQTINEVRIELPDGYEAHAWEVEAKGWYSEAVAIINGRRYPLTFYDPVRLSQNIESELKRGAPFFFEPNLIVVRSLTREHMEAAVSAIARSGEFTALTPEVEGAHAQQSGKWGAG